MRTPTFAVLPDTHLGRQFVNNVPLHRRGDRERMQWDAFKAGLDPKGSNVHIHMGDLFDKPIVSLGVIWRAAQAYMEAAVDNPDTTFVILRGNHDASRDLEMTTAFDIFSVIVRDIENVVVVDDVWAIDDMLFFGWHPLKSAAEIVKSHSYRNPRIAFGHWDVDARSDPFNLIPVAELKAIGIQGVYVGHDHLRRDLEIDGMPVHVVGSMLPYAHGEDADGTTYVTLSLDEARERAAELVNCCVRIDLQPGETFDLDLDCLQLQVRRIAEERESIDVELGEFNLQSIFENCMAENAVPEAIREQVKDEWTRRFSSTQ